MTIETKNKNINTLSNMDLQKLNDEQFGIILQELEDTDTTHFIEPDSMLRKYIDTLNPLHAIIQAPIEIWKEAARRWRKNLNSITWMGKSGVGVIRKS